MNEGKVVITTSDRNAFRRCRRSHYFSSHLHRNLRADQSHHYLTFGKAMHAGWAAYYENVDHSVEVAQALAIDAFLSDLRNGLQFFDDETAELGAGMLKNYFKWAPTVDNFTVESVETPFEFPIPVYRATMPQPTGSSFFENRGGYLFFKGCPVVYKGTVDGIVKSNHLKGHYIIEHKTASQFGSSEFLLMDDQCTAYMWGIRESTGLLVNGVIYNEAMKAVPDPIQPLKRRREGRWLSVNRAKRITLSDFMLALEEHGEPAELYEDYIEYLKVKPNPFFRRNIVRRSRGELDSFAMNLFYEVLDMLSPYTVQYPSPNRMNCNNCSYREPCNLMSRGDDWEFLLEHLFVKREAMYASTETMTLAAVPNG